MGPGDAQRTWEYLAPNAQVEADLTAALGVTPLVARTLCARGYTTPRAAGEFLSPSLDRDWHAPSCIPGLVDVANVVEKAIATHKTIAVFGDFDVDGMSATCLLTLGLTRLGAKVYPFIPRRAGEGYGLSQEALERVVDLCAPQLIVTVDNGIAARNEVAHLLEQGIDVCITDHHEPAELVPQGVPVADPKLESTCPSRELAGAGVALKLLQELCERKNQPYLWLEYLELATLGTISDMMVLNAENRALVNAGIEQMRHTLRPGLVALAATARTDLETISASDLPFSLIPRLNAAGRMDETEVAFNLLYTQSVEEATVLAARLEQINNERKACETTLTEQAQAQITAHANLRNAHCVIAAGKGWHEGVKGIVASRIASTYKLPTIIFSIDEDGLCRGSGRSRGSIDLFHAVEQCADLLVRFGGHAGAVGVTCEQKNLTAFTERLDKVLAALDPTAFLEVSKPCSIVRLSEMTIQNILDLQKLQPFGQENPIPYFVVRGVLMRDAQAVGLQKTHLRFSAADGVAMVDAIMFRAPNLDKLLHYDGVVDVVFEATCDTWRDRTKPKLMVKDIVIPTSADKFVGKDTNDVVVNSLPDTTDAVANSLLDTTEVSAITTPPEAYANLSGEALTQKLTKLLIGNNQLLSAQQQALEQLANHQSTLCVMATGRGKSLIFHVHAARCALVSHQMSIFVYPLRALVSDQAFHLTNFFEQLGLRLCVLTGQTAAQEREEIYGQLKAGAVDIVLTTPEFLALHTREFSGPRTVGFMVMDEAHHMEGAKGGNRSAYLEIPRIRQELGEPCVLAVSATVSSACAQDICELCGILPQHIIVDESVRTNLEVKDYRQVASREDALVNLVAGGEKGIVYVNSRTTAEMLVRMLRHKVQNLAPHIAFYHAGLTRATRLKVEQAFRSDYVKCIVATSAFGEGVNLPDVRYVALYTLPYDQTEFNQMSGRAGRDGKLAQVYMMFNQTDCEVNCGVLGSAAPSRTKLVTLYKQLVNASLHTPHNTLTGDDATIAQILETSSTKETTHSQTAASPQGDVLATALGIFEELGFLTIQGYGETRQITLLPNPRFTPLETSIRYSEGLRAQNAFETFSTWVLSASAQELLDRINKPLVPTQGKRVS